jgi:hypothetical protein
MKGTGMFVGLTTAATVLLLAAAAAAQTAPSPALFDIKGTWTGTSEGIVAGSAGTLQLRMKRVK